AAPQDGAAARPLRQRSEGRRPPLPSADPERLLHPEGEEFAIADLAGLGGVLDGLGHHGCAVVVHEDLELHLGEELDHVLRTPVELGVPLLPPESLDLGHGHPFHALLRQRLLHLVELERLDDGFDLLHRLPPWRRSRRPTFRRVRNLSTAPDPGPYRTCRISLDHQLRRSARGRTTTFIGRTCSILGNGGMPFARVGNRRARAARSPGARIHDSVHPVLPKPGARAHEAGTRSEPTTLLPGRASPSPHGLPATGAWHPSALAVPRAAYRRRLCRGRSGAVALRPLSPAGGQGGGPG